MLFPPTGKKESHRGHVMRKMKACSLADLVKIAVLLQLTSWA